MDPIEAAAASLPRTLAAVIALSAAAVAMAVTAFELTVAGALAVYFVVWWTVLFVVLPFGVGPAADEVVPGTEPGAPAMPRLNEKAIWTTILAALLFVAIVAAMPLAGL